MEADVVSAIATAIDARLHDAASPKRTEIIAAAINSYLETHCSECGSERGLNRYGHREYCYCTADD
jgi:hypothetical protein